MIYTFLQNGDTAVTVQFKNEISKEVNGYVTSLSDRMEKEGIKGVTELIPAFASLTVVYDPVVISSRKLQRKIKRLLSSVRENQKSDKVIYKIPVCYEGDFAPDMEHVISYTGLSREEIVRLHTGTDYLIYMLGFLPGFAYLGGMDSRLNTPRLASPRAEIFEGAVGIGGEQTGIYPVASPGGWQLIGKTPVKVYDKSKENPILYKAGEYIRFFSVSYEEYLQIEKAVQAGTYTVERTVLA